MEKKKTWYAWVIFGTCFLMSFVALGFGSSSKSTFLTAVTGALGLERAKFSISDSLRFITSAVASFFLGATIKKLGVRKMVFIGFMSLAVSFLMNSYAVEIATFLCGGTYDTSSFWTYLPFYVSGVLLGLGFSWATTSLVGYIVENWFTNSKGTITGIIMASNGLGGVAAENIITRIIFGSDGSLTDEASRWQDGYRFVALLVFVVGIIAVLLIRERPSDIGFSPLGEGAKKKKARGNDWAGVEEKTLYRKPFFWISILAVFMIGIALQSLANVAKPYMYDLGYDKTWVIGVFSLHFVFLMVSKILAGWFYDHFKIRKTYVILACGTFIALLSLVFLQEASVTGGTSALPWLFSLFSAIGLPLETVMVPLIAKEFAGKKSFAKLLGFYFCASYAGYAVGIPVANAFYDIMGTYRYYIIGLLVVIIVTVILQEFSFMKVLKLQKEVEKQEEKTVKA